MENALEICKQITSMELRGNIIPSIFISSIGRLGRASKDPNFTNALLIAHILGDICSWHILSDGNKKFKGPFLTIIYAKMARDLDVSKRSIQRSFRFLVTHKTIVKRQLNNTALIQCFPNPPGIKRLITPPDKVVNITHKVNKKIA